MRKRQAVALVAAGIGVAAVVALGALTSRSATAGDANPTRVVVEAAEPDTGSPNWRFLSDGVGIMIREDDRLGLRGRFYLRVKGTWRPVAVDGAADILRAVPVK
jgi:hypothetical protein